MKNKIYKILLLVVLIFSINVVNASEEKAYGYIPEEYNNIYEIDASKYKINRRSGIYNFYSAIPTKYDLRNVNGKRYIPPVDDQGTAPFCWAFASNNTIESYYLKHNLGTIDLSDNQPAYVSYYYGDSEYGFHSGNSAINTLKYWFLGHSPVTESLFGKYSVSQEQKAYKDYLDSSNLEFDIKDVIVFPMLLTDYALQNYTVQQVQMIMNDYTSSMKNHIMNHGALFTGIFMYFLNEETNLMYDDGTVSHELEEVAKSAHAVTIVGWDDTIEGVTIKGTPVKGAWIAMNSWGDTQQYFYISYYDRSVVQSLFGVQNIESKEWDNIYTDKKMVSNTPNTKIYEFQKNEGNEIVDAIKILYRAEDSNINISISDGYNIYESITPKSTTFGIKTYEFDNLVLNTDKVYVIVDSSFPTEKYDIALFTKNEEIIKTLDVRDETFNNSQSTFKNFKYDVITKNIPSGTTLNVKVLDDQNADVTNKLTVKSSIIVNGHASLELNIRTQGSLEYSKYLKIQVTADGITQTVTQYNNGDGSINDPYIIRYPYELILFDQQGYYFELGNDIDLYEDTNSMFGYFYNNNYGWNPVTFKSSLDGKGFSIKNLRTTKGSMFENIDNGIIKNIKLDSFNISDANNTTTIPGIMTKNLKNNSEISNVYLNNSSIDSIINSVGGLVGIIYDGKIENVHIKDSSINSENYSGIVAAKLLNPTNSITIKNVYSINTPITGDTKGMIGNVEFTSKLEDVKPFIIMNNVIHNNEELNLIGKENIKITDSEDDLYIVSSAVNKIITDNDIYNSNMFEDFDSEIWSFDTVNSAYLILFENEFDNLLKLKTYQIQEDMIYQVKSETKISDFINDITNIQDLEYTMYSSDGTELSDENDVTTGSYMDVSNESKTKRYYIVVAGDTDGNGTSGAIDAYAIVLHTVGKKELTGNYLLAADYNLDGSVGARDAYAIVLDSLN